MTPSGFILLTCRCTSACFIGVCRRGPNAFAGFSHLSTSTTNFIGVTRAGVARTLVLKTSEISMHTSTRCSRMVLPSCMIAFPRISGGMYDVGTPVSSCMTIICSEFESTCRC